MPDPVGKTPRHWWVDEQSIAEFAKHMSAKMAANRHKAHWSTVSQSWLFDRLLDEVGELAVALEEGDLDGVAAECADVANFAMMIADNAGRT